MQELRNPFSKSSSPASSGVVERAPVTKREPQKPQETIEEKEYKNRMNLGPLWAKRRITTDALKERGVKIDLADSEEYSKRRKEHQPMKGSEEAGAAEIVFIEGADTGGRVKEDFDPYAWFGDEVVAYPAHPFDDVLRGTDALLMCIDQENERRAHPISVDTTTDRVGYDEKLGRDLYLLREGVMPNVYWADTATPNPGEYFDDPQEGRVRSMNLSVYLPSEAVKKFTDPKTLNADADLVMKKMGPFVVRQMQSELEAMAKQFLGLHPRESQHLSRKGLLSMLEASRESGIRTAGGEAIRDRLFHVLQMVWRAVDRLGPVRPEHEELLPMSIRERPPLPKGPDVSRKLRQPSP